VEAQGRSAYLVEDLELNTADAFYRRKDSCTVDKSKSDAYFVFDRSLLMGEGGEEIEWLRKTTMRF
jgi:hypothetical protein